MSETNGNGEAAKVERRILSDVARWMIPLALVAILGFVWNTNAKVQALEIRIVRLEVAGGMAKAKPPRGGHRGEAQAAAPAPTTRGVAPADVDGITRP